MGLLLVSYRIFITSFAILATMSCNLEARVLKNLHWLSAENLHKPIYLNMNGRRVELNRDIAEITEFYRNKEFDYFLLPRQKSFQDASSLKCAENLKKNVYLLRPKTDKPVTLPENLDWSENPFNDRNWEFWFHSWQFANCLRAGHQMTGDTWYLQRLKWLVNDWWDDNFKPDFPSKGFSWYDHSIPKRLHELALIWEYVRRHEVLDEEFVHLTLQFAYWHARILAEETDIYVKHHNHGLDQSFRLFEASQIFPELDLAKSWQLLAAERLQDELVFALGNEGVHVENSPGYHSWISAYNVKIDQFAKHYTGAGILQNVRQLAEEGLKYLVAISRPDRFFPPLGDTANDVRVRAPYPDLAGMAWYEAFQYTSSDGERGVPPEQTSFVFPESGYYIYRDSWDLPGRNESVHFVLKCGFLARGHRHNDDGNILLYGLGEDWLIDAGIYGYSPNDPYRNYVVGASAHNISIPLGAEESQDLHRKDDHYRDDWGLVDWADDRAQCKSHMYVGYTYQRTMEVTGKRSFRLLDRLMPEVPTNTLTREFVTIFRVPDDKTVLIDRHASTVHIMNSAGSAALEIDYNPEEISSVKLIRGEREGIMALATSGWKKMKPVQAILFSKTGQQYTAGFDLSLTRSPEASQAKKMVFSE